MCIQCESKQMQLCISSVEGVGVDGVVGNRTRTSLRVLHLRARPFMQISPLSNSASGPGDGT